MKLELESLYIENSSQSFRFFQTEVNAFTPFWHYHPELELTLITKGEGTRFIGDSIEPFHDFDLVLVGKNVPHHWVSLQAGNTEPQRASVFQFSKDIFHSFNECDHFLSLFDKAKRGIHFLNPSNNCIDRILTFDQLTPIEQLGSLLTLIEELSQHRDVRFLASETYQTGQDRKFIEEKFSKVNNYILENLHTKLTVNQMAEFTHMVPQSFCRWFKKYSGHSFITFLNLTRIERSCQYLITTSDSIQTIAYNSGFDTISHFNRTFKAIKNMSPSEVRKKYKGV